MEFVEKNKKPREIQLSKRSYCFFAMSSAAATIALFGSGVSANMLSVRMVAELFILIAMAVFCIAAGMTLFAFWHPSEKKISFDLHSLLMGFSLFLCGLGYVKSSLILLLVGIGIFAFSFGGFLFEGRFSYRDCPFLHT